MVRIITLLIMSLLFCCTSGSDDSSELRRISPKFTQSNFDDALDEAGSNNKLLLVDIYADW